MKHKLLSFRTTLPTIVFLSIAASPLGHAQTSTWTNNGDGIFSDAINWSNGVPGTGVDAVIDDGDTAVTVTSTSSTALNNLTLGSDDTLLISNGTFFSIDGDLVNNGLIQLNSTANTTNLNITGGGNHTFSGNGILRLGQGVQNQVRGNGTLINSSTHTISGGGSLGSSAISINNAGTIRADESGVTMLIEVASPGLTNTGALRAENGGTLSLSGGGGFNNTGGTITALAGSEVRLRNGAQISGGVLSTSGDGVIITDGAFLENLSNTGQLQFQGASTISGTITNSGSISAAAPGSSLEMRILSGGASLDGGGTLRLENNGSRIRSFTPGTRFTNVDNTISGFGQIGQNSAVITNETGGTIQADVSGQNLILDPAATATDGGATFLNNGILRATGGGTLSLTGNSGGDFTNGTGGTFEVLDGSTLGMTNGAVLTNNSASTLSGGIYRAVDSGNGASLTLLGTPVTSLAAGTTVDLSGANSNITFNGTALSQTLTSNAGTLRLRDGRVFNNTNALANSGTLALEGGTFSAPALVSGGEVGGFGNVNVRVVNSGSVVANGGTLVLSDGIGASGTTSSVTVEAGAALDISSGANSSTATLAHNGTDLNLGTNDIIVSSDYTNANFGTGNSFDARANVSGTGAINASGNVVQGITGDVTGGNLEFGNVHVGDSNTLTYQVANNGTSGPVLRGAIQTAANGGNVSDSRLSGAGATAGNFGPVSTIGLSADLDVTFTATSAGALTGQTIHVENNFDNVAGSDIEINGAAFRLAAPTVTPTPVNFGIVHVGDMVSRTLTLTNGATADGFSESLNASFSSSSTGISTSGAVSGLVAGANDSSSLTISLDTAAAGFVTENAMLAFESDGSGTSELGITSLAGAGVSVTGQINNFALADFALDSGTGTFTRNSATSYTLDFGTAMLDATGFNAALAVANDVLGPADTLAGSFAGTGDPGFSFSGFLSFAGIAAGDSQSGFSIGLDTSSEGTFTTSFFFDPRSQNASGFDGGLDRITLNVTGTVVPEPSSSALLALGLFSLALRRKRA